MIVAAKNFAGHRSGGKTQKDPIIWNNCGQVVIPGGGIKGGEGPTVAGQREFCEETGVDLREDKVRRAMHCLGPAVACLLKDREDRQFWCVYQAIASDSQLVRTVNENIKASIPEDDELHDAGLASVGRAGSVFGPCSLDRDWRSEQFRVLVPPWSEQALERSNDPFDWFLIAAANIPGEDGRCPDPSAEGTSTA